MTQLYDETLALRLAYLSSAAYYLDRDRYPKHTAGDVEAAFSERLEHAGFPGLGWGAVEPFFTPDAHFGGFMLQYPGEAYLVFRGTDPVLNWVTNFRYRLEDRGYADTRVHSGFAGVLEEPGMWARIQLLADRAWPLQTIHITGHSLGAALATLTAWWFANKWYRRWPLLYTFASPRVGDRRFRETFDSACIHQRVVRVGDRVPDLPPLFPGSWETHTGVERRIGAADTRWWQWTGLEAHSLDKSYIPALGGATPTQLS